MSTHTHHNNVQGPDIRVTWDKLSAGLDKLLSVSREQADVTQVMSKMEYMSLYSYVPSLCSRIQRAHCMPFAKRNPYFYFYC